MAIPENTETLEKLLIEIVGDDSNLKAFLDDAVKAAQKAAEEMRDALNQDWERVSRGAQAAASAFEGVAPSAQEANAAFEMFTSGAQQAFDDMRRAGRLTNEEFEEYRRTMLQTIETQRPLAQAAGVTSSALDDLAKHVREAAYEQAEQSRQTERTKQEQSELGETIKRLSNIIRSSRNEWAGRITSDKEFRQSTSETKEELIDLLKTVERGSDEYRKLSQELAYAQRGLDSVNKVASRGGLAWTAQIALANQFGQQLRGLGPAGAVAAGGLGLVQSGVSSLFQPVTMADVSFKRLAGTVTRFGLVIAPLAGLLAGIAGGAVLVRLTTQAADYARELENASFRTGLTVEGLQELQHAARSTGVPLDLLNTTMQRLQRRAADANSGNAGLRESFDRLGVSLTDANGQMRSTEDLLGQVADGLNSVENNADRLALAFKVFDTEGGRLLPLLAEGSEGIRALREEARELGLVISGDTILTLSDLKAELETNKQQFQVLGVEIAAAFLPLMRDVLMPFVSGTVIPKLQEWSGELIELAETFFDAGEEGEQLRAKVANLLVPLAAAGDIAVIAGTAVFGGIQTISTAIQLLANEVKIYIASVKEDWRNLWIGWQTDVGPMRRFWDERHGEGSFDAVMGIDPASESETIANLRASGDRLMEGYLDNLELWSEPLRSAISRLFGGGYADGIETAFGTITANMRTRPPRGAAAAGTALGTETGNAAREALEGSLAHAERELRKALEDFNFAATDEARESAWAVAQEWQATIDAIKSAFEDDDATAAARAWSDRLAAEMTHGLKTAVEVRGIIAPRVAELRAEAAAALAAGDMSTYQEATAKLEPLERLLNSIEGQAVDLTGAMSGVTAEISDSTTSALEFLAAQRAAREEAARLLAVYRDLSSMGASLEDRMAFLAGGPFAGALLTGPDMSDVVPLAVEPIALVNDEVDRLRETIAAMVEKGEDEAGILRMIERLTTLTPMSVAQLNELTGGWYTARNAAGEYRQSAEEAFNEFPSTPPVVATLTARLAPALDEARERARALGEEFDYVAAEQAALTSVITELGNKTNLTTGELAVYEQAIARLAELNTAKAGQVTDELFRAWLDGVNQLGVSLDPLDRAALALQELDLTSEQLAAGLEALAAVGDRLAQAEFDATLESWSEAVARIGVAADPIAELRAQLEALFEGREDLEEYAAALQLLADAEARRANAQGDAEAERAEEAWNAASSSIAGFLRVTQADFSDLREAAEEAFSAGVIGAEELAAALKAIGVMETVENFRILAGELHGLQSLVPQLMGDFTQAFAMLAAGNTTDAVAVGFRAAANAVDALGAAFDDAANRGEAMLDLVIGAAAGIATAIGGPALGQAVGAVGQFFKSILGDLSNGLAEIQRQVDQTASRSTYLGESLIQGIAEGATSRVSRGGIAGFLGFTKAQLDEDAFRAGVSMAESIASGLVNTLRAGDFEDAWKSMIDDILIQGLIERFMARDAIQQAIEDAFLLMDAGDTAGAARRLDQVKEDFRFIWEQIQEITGATDELAINVSGALTSGFTSALNSSTWAEAWDKATLMMKNTLRDAIVQAFIEGEAMSRIFEEFNQALNAALEDGVISDKELEELERIFAATEGPMQELWAVLERLGLSFDDLNDTVNNVTSSLSNVPNVFLDTQATFDSVAGGGRGGWAASASAPFPGGDATHITITGDVYGWDDFEEKVNDAVAQGRWRSGIAQHGVG